MKNLSLQLFRDTELMPILIACIIFTVLALVPFLLFSRKHNNSSAEDTDERDHLLSFVRYTPKKLKYSSKDWLTLTVITGCYAMISLWQLGTRSFPVTTWQPTSATGLQDVVFHLTEDTAFDGIYMIYGEGDNNSNPDTYQLGTENMVVYGSNDNINWTELTTMDKGSIYQYQIKDGIWDFEYVWIRSNNKNNSLTEFGLRSSDHTHFLKMEVELDGSAETQYPATLLIDEQDKLVMTPTYYDEGYFDEIYHPRNAWEIANGQAMYATVHPLVGTNIMAFFIKLFGMSPFVWRLPGALTGIALVPLLYAIARRLFRSTPMAGIAAVLLAGDFMHLTTSRIGTLEPFSVFFILLMFYFMLRYVQMSFYDTAYLTQFKWLALCGITMGVAIATKWTACYSAVGLAILLFAYFFMEFREYLKAGQLLRIIHITAEEREEAERIRSIFFPRFWKTIALCFVFFIGVPIVIYALSYLPDHVWKGESWSFANVWKQCLYMYNYHIDLEATHPYSSTWNQWLLDARPIWYYNGIDAEGLQHSISCFSNPLMTWAALPAIGFTLIDGVRTQNRAAFFIVIGYATALAPWIIITRCVFAYHFYPTSFFAILSIVYLFKYLYQGGKIGKAVILVYLIAYTAIFLTFLPVTAGFGTDNAYIKALEWFDSWYFG